MDTKTCEVLRTFEHGGMKHAGARVEIESAFADRLASGGRPFVRILSGRLPAGATTPEAKAEAALTPEDDLRAEWDATGLKSNPAAYLKRSPDGPHSELAQRLVQNGLGSYAT